MEKKAQNAETPSIEAIEAELQRVNYNDRYRKALKGTVFTLIVVAAIAILISTLWMPFLRIYGSSMAPTLQDGEIICCIKSTDFKRGDIVAFYYNNKILLKRVIGLPGDWINIDKNGKVYVNDEPIREDYLIETAFGECDIDLPYQVPDEKIFVMGDHRSTSIDSRHSSVGCISDDQIVGKTLIRIWPIKRIDIF